MLNGKRVAKANEMRTGSGGIITTVKDFHALVGIDAAWPSSSVRRTRSKHRSYKATIRGVPEILVCRMSQKDVDVYCK
jgi:hypothetical protein